MGAPGRRRRAREAALQVLFAADQAERIELPHVEQVFQEIIEAFSLPSRARARALELAQGVARDLESIDAHISLACMNWKLPRMAAVDRNILRVATYELLREPETPTEVIIDEAVEIARRFSSNSAPAFVNGVLDVIAKELSRGSS